MKGLPAAIKDENGGWSTAYWYPHAPPTKGVTETCMRWKLTIQGIHQFEMSYYMVTVETMDIM
jgi:hypothetical protein